jgi:hypothetical protein
MGATQRITEPTILCAFDATAFPLFSTRHLTAVCQHDNDVFPAAAVTVACGAHPRPYAARSCATDRYRTVACS